MNSGKVGVQEQVWYDARCLQAVTLLATLPDLHCRRVYRHLGSIGDISCFALVAGFGAISRIGRGWDGAPVADLSSVRPSWLVSSSSSMASFFPS